MTNRLTQAIVLSAVSALLLLVLIPAPSAFAQPAVQVKVTEETLGSQTVYSYRVVNQGSQPVVAVRVGFDYLHGVPELPVPPAGWTFDDGLPPLSAAAPAGWETRVVTTEESPSFDIEWSNESGPAADIAPGTSRAGFRVVLPAPSGAYKTAHFDIILGDSTHISDSIVIDDAPPPPGDVTPPTLTVALTPSSLWPPNHKMVAIQAEITVQDDQDPSPAVKLVSLTCNETSDPARDIAGAAYGTDDRTFSVRAERTGQRKEGRVYTVTYSATDAGGNTTTATATVTVPHDQSH